MGQPSSAEEHLLRRSWRWWVVVAAAIAALFVLLVQASHYLPFITDDALISLRYARRLLEGHGLTWTEGPRVEGYSNLLWTLLVAGGGALGLDLIVAARVLGVICGGLVIAALAVGARPWSRDARVVGVAAGLLTYALAGPVAAWTIGGLEQPLVAALLAWVMVLSVRHLDMEARARRDTILLSAALGLLCLTRPDGALFTAGMVGVLIVWRGPRRETMRLAALVMVAPVACVLGQEIFRLLYYGAWVPNTALVKISLSSSRVVHGLHYVERGLGSLAPLSVIWLALLAVLALDRAQRAIAVLAVGMTLPWLCYVAVIGGDIFAAHRHMVPVVVIMAFTVSWGVAFMWRAHRSRLVRVLVLVLLGVAFPAYAAVQLGDADNRRAAEETWEWEGRVVGLALQRAFGDREPLFAVTAAGCLPYWSRLPSLDMLGLNDSYLARHPPPDFGHGQLAHELGDGRYVLDREPDVISFCGPWGSMRPCYRSGIEMERDPRFHASYTPITVRGVDPHPWTSILWVRRESARIGIRRQADRVTVPGYLLDGQPDAWVHPAGDGHLVSTVSPGHPLGVDLALPAGRWRTAVVSERPELVTTDVSRGARGRVAITLRASGFAPVEVREVELRRVDEP